MMTPPELIALLVSQVELVWSSTLRGDTSTRVQAMFRLMIAPAKIGDLVLIGMVSPSWPAEDRIGWLEKIEDEPYDIEDGVASGYTRYWTIRRLTEGTIRWTNVKVLRVPKEQRDDLLVPITNPESSEGKENGR